MATIITTWEPLPDGHYHDDAKHHYLSVHGSRIRTAYDCAEGPEVELAANVRLCQATEREVVSVPDEVRYTIESALRTVRADMAPVSVLLAHRVAAIDVALAWLKGQEE